MSGINRPEGRPALSGAKSLEGKHKKTEKAPKSLLEVGVASSKAPKIKTTYKTSTITKTEGIKVKASVEKVREKAPAPKRTSADSSAHRDKAPKRDETVPRKRRVKEHDKKTEKPPKSLLEEATSKTEGIKVKASVEKVRERAPAPKKTSADSSAHQRDEAVPRPQVVERNKVINRLFDHLSSRYVDVEKLRLNLELGLGNFDKESHTFVVGSHIILVSKDNPDKTTIAITNVARKSFARGGFGKLYPVTILDSNSNELALKLSRKKLDKESLQKNTAMPTRKGERAKNSVEQELKVINFILRNVQDPIGLNVDMFGKVIFNNQAGYFLRRFDSDLNVFRFENKNIPPEVCYQIMSQIITGMNTMHKLGLVHRDIKPDNILVEKTGQLIEGTEIPSFNSVLSDFGNTATLKGIFSTIHPSFNTIFGVATDCYVSNKYVNKVEGYLDQLDKLLPMQDKYNEIVAKIKKILIKNDRFALSLSFYMMWTRKLPPFKSFIDEVYFDFNKGSTLIENKKILDSMTQELRSASLHFSHSLYGDSEYIAKAIMIPIISGLIV